MTLTIGTRLRFLSSVEHTIWEVTKKSLGDSYTLTCVESPLTPRGFSYVGNTYPYFTLAKLHDNNKYWSIIRHEPGDYAGWLSVLTPAAKESR